LVTDEYRNGLMFTKFPGGGLEFGEGIIDCLKREFIEEMNCEIEVGNHFYTTDYFQVSAFNPNHQLISIYYQVNSNKIKETAFNFEKFGFEKMQEGAQIFRWVDIERLKEDDFMFPVDKIVSNKLKEQYYKL
jgi:ADP-ribose pyrophosphatase YjhB (NUDIX family)